MKHRLARGKQTYIPSQSDMASATGGFLVNWLVILLLGVFALVAGGVWHREYRLARSAAALNGIVELAGRGGIVSSGSVGGRASGDYSGDSPQLWLVQANSFALEAHGLQGIERDNLLEQARLNTYNAIAARPHWAEAWVTLAYVEMLTGPARIGAATMALISSYRDGPFLKGAAAWRAETGIRLWARLDAKTRDHMLDEAVWIAMQDPVARLHLFAVARESSAYPALLAKWREARSRERLEREYRGMTR